MRRRLIVAAGVVVLALVGAGVAYYLHIQQQARDIKGSSTIEFVTTEAAVPPPPEPGIAWPTYGHDAERQRVASPECPNGDRGTERNERDDEPDHHVALRARPLPATRTR